MINKILQKQPWRNTTQRLISYVRRKQPWRNPISRSASRLLNASQQRRERHDYLFEDIGRNYISRPVGRCLIAYTPYFIRYLYEHLEIGPKEWNPSILSSQATQLASAFSYHSMYWESAELVGQCIDRGLIVDYVCDRHGYLVKDISKYDVIIDEWANLPLWSAINPSAKKLFYATSAHWIFHNKAELVRHEWLLQRRGVEIETNRQLPHLLSDHHADLITSFGTSQVNSTFGPNTSKIRKLCLSAADDDIELQAKNWVKARRAFLFFASAPWLHKGLDLVVEAFLKEPDLTLHIVTSGVERNSDFWRIYGREIEASGNIQVHGFMDVHSPQFHELVASCVGTVYPSASEGCAGAAVQCLHHGLIPIFTPMVGISAQDKWPNLKGESDAELIEEIRVRCQELSQMSEAQLEELRNSSWQYARMNHTRTLYAESLSKVLDELLEPRNFKSAWYPTISFKEWENFLSDQPGDESRTYCYELIKKLCQDNNQMVFTEIGFGQCRDFQACFRTLTDIGQIRYRGYDITEQFLRYAKRKFPDYDFRFGGFLELDECDILYTRHTLEHQDPKDYEACIKNMLSKTKGHCIIVWFIPPGGHEKIVWVPSDGLKAQAGAYVNTYNEKKLLKLINGCGFNVQKIQVGANLIYHCAKTLQKVNKPCKTERKRIQKI